jgi:chaperone modulatory protein CbpM
MSASRPARDVPRNRSGMATYALARPHRLALEPFANSAGLHPEQVRRLVALGLLEAAPDAAGELWFPPNQLAAAARLQRLRDGLALNYAALGLVVDLLDRIAALEAALRSQPRPIARGGPTWTRTV